MFAHNILTNLYSILSMNKGCPSNSILIAFYMLFIINIYFIIKTNKFLCLGDDYCLLEKIFFNFIFLTISMLIINTIIEVLPISIIKSIGAFIMIILLVIKVSSTNKKDFKYAILKKLSKILNK